LGFFALVAVLVMDVVNGHETPVYDVSAALEGDVGRPVFCQGKVDGELFPAGGADLYGGGDVAAAGSLDGAGDAAGAAGEGFIFYAAFIGANVKVAWP
jgi:hypothetical protein